MVVTFAVDGGLTVLSRHWPIGVLFDLHTSFDPTSAIDGPGQHPHLPWQLTIHFQDYPKDVLTRRDPPDSFRDVWLNNLKEVATFLPLPRSAFLMFPG